MNTAKRLAMAAGAFLQYEFACQRDTLFNERSLVTPISNVLKAVYKHDVHTEFLHPALAPLKSGPGRRPEVDFAVDECKDARLSRQGSARAFLFERARCFGYS
jgi:hypothetical protein